MTDENAASEKTKRFRSPPYPAFALEKAIERTSHLFSEAHHHEVGVSVLAEAWGMAAGGKVWRHAAGLIQYGLLVDDGRGNSRKFRITDTGRRLAQDSDPRSEKRRAALKEAALSPMIYAELWNKFGTGKDVSDAVLKTYLTIDRAERGEAPYSKGAAEEVVTFYRSTLTFAGLTETEHKNADNGASAEAERHGKNKLRHKFSGVDNDPSSLDSSGSDALEKGDGELNPKADISVHQVGGHLKITAEVDLAGVEKLEKILAKYKEILSMLN